jgi:5-methylcytosine-specific restriction endonuclease McrA
VITELEFRQSGDGGGPGDGHTDLDFEAGRCVNCDGPGVTVTAPLYCSPRCKQAAGLVRYVRARRADGMESRPDIREAIQMRLAMVLGGGYPEARRQVTAEVRAVIYARAEGQCEECGCLLDRDGSSGNPDSLATIQHVNGNSNDPENLKAFCRRCNMADAQAKFVRVEPGSSQGLIARQLAERWSSPKPLRLCDVANWNDIWSALAREAKDVLRQWEELDESAGDEDLPGFMGWTDGGTPIQEC